MIMEETPMNKENIETLLNLLETKVQGIETLADHLYNHNLPRSAKNLLFLLNNEVGELKRTIKDGLDLLYDEDVNTDDNTEDKQYDNFDDQYDDYNYEETENDGL